MDSFFGELIKLGAAGLVIYVIAAPLIKYLIDRSKVQDDRMAQLVDLHLKQDTERHQKTIASLNLVERNLNNVERVLSALPQTMLSEVQKIYPPMNNQPSTTTVNVSQPASFSQQTKPLQPLPDKA